MCLKMIWMMTVILAGTSAYAHDYARKLSSTDDLFQPVQKQLVGLPTTDKCFDLALQKAKVAQNKIQRKQLLAKSFSSCKKFDSARTQVIVKAMAANCNGFIMAEQSSVIAMADVEGKIFQSQQPARLDQPRLSCQKALNLAVSGFIKLANYRVQGSITNEANELSLAGN